ncbi:MAG: hypothetical protein WCS09_02925 [Pseudomonadota bacterium]
MAPAPAAPLYRITPLTPDRSLRWTENDPIEVPRGHVAAVVLALRRGGVRRIRLQQVTDEVELLDMLAPDRLPALMRRQCA